MRSVFVRSLSSAALVAFVAGCATTVPLQPTDRNPASTGELSIKEGKNQNTEVTLKLKHLPQANMLDPSLTTFVAWVRPKDGGQFTNIGQIDIDATRTGKLKTVTPYNDFFVVVTGEASATAPRPSEYVVLQGTVNR